MNKFSLKKSMAMALAVVMVLALSAVPVFADELVYEPVAGGSTTFGQALIVDKDAGVPNSTVSYSIVAGEHRDPAGADEREVMPGLDADKITISNAIFGPADTAALANPTAGVTLTADQRAVAKEVTIDLSRVSFPEPGIYRYIITMQNAGEQGMAYDTQAQNTDEAGFVAKTRILDVYVTDNGQGVLAVEGRVIHELNKATEEVAQNGDRVSDKSGAGGSKGAVGGGIVYVNEYSTFDLSVSKAVSGNQASRDKYFKFTVSITNAGANCDLQVSGAEAAPIKSGSTDYEAAVMTAANTADDSTGEGSAAVAEKWTFDGVDYATEAEAKAAAEAAQGAAAGEGDYSGIVHTEGQAAVPAGIAGIQWKTDASGAVEKDVYLKHGDELIIGGLAAGAKYTVTEVPEDYTPATSLKKGDAAAITGTAAEVAEAEGMAANHDLDYTNSRSGMIPTGVVLSAIPGIALIGIGGGYMIAVSRKKKEDEE